MQRAAIPPPRGGVAASAGLVHALSGRTMGTTWAVKLVAPELPGDLGAAVQTVLDGLVAQISHWEPPSEISRVNAAAAGAWTPVSSDLERVLRCALEIAMRTDGAFDPGLGGAAARWGFGPPGAPTGFTPGAWRRVRVEDGRVLQPGGAHLDLSGIGKGYAVDLLAALLVERGAASFLVEVGGELYGRGVKPDGSPWWAAIDPPREGAADEVRVALPGWAVATSGDYRRFLSVDGRRWAHTLDPRTGAPLADVPASVTVLAPECMRADAWATALTVMGAREGLAFADRLGLAALFLVVEGAQVRAVASAGWAELWA